MARAGRASYLNTCTHCFFLCNTLPPTDSLSTVHFDLCTHNSLYFLHEQPILITMAEEESLHRFACGECVFRDVFRGVVH